MPQPFWRLWFGPHERDFGRRTRLVAVLVVECILLILLVFGVGTVVIPLAAPTLETPTATPTSIGG